MLTEEDIHNVVLRTYWQKDTFMAASHAAQEMMNVYEEMIMRGALIRRDELESETEVGDICGQPVRYVTIGRSKYAKKITEAELKELLRRGAIVTE